MFPLGQVPCFTFLGRRDEMDLVGDRARYMADRAKDIELAKRIQTISWVG